MICLRPMNLSDVDDVLRWENNPDNWHFSNTDSPYSKADIIGLVEELSKADAGQQRFIICDDTTERRIGALDLFEIDRETKTGGVGVLIAEKEDRLKGYAKKALELLEIECSGYGVNKLMASVHNWNESSLNLFRSAGFQEVDMEKDLIKFEKCLKK